VERDAAVVDTVETELLAAIGDLDARVKLPVLVAEGHEDRVHAARFAADDKLAEDGGEAAVRGRVADVVLAGVLVRRLDHQLARAGVVGGDGADPLHVRAVAGLAHGEGSGQLERGDLIEVGLVVLARAQVVDRAAEEAELDPALDQEREVAVTERLEGRDRRAHPAEAAELGREEK
jgi:hypothetical protein